MALIKFKPTAVVSKQAIIACAVVNAANQIGLVDDMLVTSGNDSKHMAGSKHYTDQALDFRTKHLSKRDKQFLVETIRKRLGRDYEAFIEAEGLMNEHLHVEYDPKP